MLSVPTRNTQSEIELMLTRGCSTDVVALYKVLLPSNLTSCVFGRAFRQFTLAILPKALFLPGKHLQIYSLVTSTIVLSTIVSMILHTDWRTYRTQRIHGCCWPSPWYLGSTRLHPSAPSLLLVSIATVPR